MTRDFRHLIERKWQQERHVCVGLDSDPRRLHTQELPYHPDAPDALQVEFNVRIVEATKHVACAYKPNLAFYKRDSGKERLKRTITLINQIAPDIPVVLDAKYGDIDSTNDGYVEDAFDFYGADAVTVHNYMGRDAMQPFLKQRTKGIFVLCRTSNKGADEFQNLCIDRTGFRKLYEVVALNVAETWNENGNCGLVVGATVPDELARVRAVAPDIPILIPGIGAQGGDLEKTVTAARHRFIINSSRGIIFASTRPDFADAARKEATRLHEAIRALL